MSRKSVPYSFDKCGEIINEPRIGSLIWYCENKPNMRLVIINSGQYLDSRFGRLSNFWYWQEVFEDGSLGWEESGYGHFYQYKGFYDVERKVSFR